MKGLTSNHILFRCGLTSILHGSATIFLSLPEILRFHNYPLIVQYIWIFLQYQFHLSLCIRNSCCWHICAWSKLHPTPITSIPL